MKWKSYPNRMHNGNWFPICYDSIALTTCRLLCVACVYVCVCVCGPCRTSAAKLFSMFLQTKQKLELWTNAVWNSGSHRLCIHVLSFSTFCLLIFRRFPDAVFCCCFMYVLLLSVLLLLFWFVCLMLFTFICRVHYSKSFRCRRLTCLRWMDG